MVRQKDVAWQTQTGAPADPQAGNIPGGFRDVLRTANFNDGQTQGLAADSGTWAVSGGALQVASTSRQADAVAVYQIGEALPSYFEVVGTIKVVKPTAGWNANSYVVFDYQDANNFKFAGLNVSTNKLEMGIRTAAGWQVLKQASFPTSLRSDVWYNVMLSVNGLTATLTVDNTNAFSHTFAATVLDGWSYGLNWGLVGLGSNKSRGEMDNISVQVVPPALTVSRTDDFTTGTGPMVGAAADARTGTWAAVAGRFSGTPLAGSDRAIQLLNLNGVTQMTAATLLELSTTFRTTGLSGIVFDRYNDKDFKFAAIDMPNKQIVIGHVKGGSVSIDAWVARSTLLATVDYKLGVSIKGLTVSVTVNDQAAVGFVFNAVASDGRFGLFSHGATASFDTVTVKTNDPSIPAAQTLLGTAQTLNLAAPTLSLEQAAPLLAEGKRRWALVEDKLHVALLDGVELQVADLPGEALAEYRQGVITVDVDAGGAGWYIDAVATDDNEFSGAGAVLQARAGGPAQAGVDLLSVISHELGHAMGLGHADGGVMSAELTAGQRSTPEIWGRLGAQPGKAAGTSLLPPVAAVARVDIDWSRRLHGERIEATAGGAGGAELLAGLARPTAASKLSPAWQQRFVNDLGFDAQSLRPNAGLALHLPVVSKTTARVQSR